MKIIMKGVSSDEGHKIAGELLSEPGSAALGPVEFKLIQLADAEKPVIEIESKDEEKIADARLLLVGLPTVIYLEEHLGIEVTLLDIRRLDKPRSRMSGGADLKGLLPIDVNVR